MNRRRDTVDSFADRLFIQPLEPRLLLSTPGDVQPETLAGFDQTERSALIARMTNLPGQADFAAKITKRAADIRRFDEAIRDYMRTRTNVENTFASGDAAAIGAFIKSNLDTSGTLNGANNLIDNRVFVDSGDTGDSAGPLTGNVDFRAPNGGLGDDFSLSVNRFEYWGGLADSVWLGNDPARYTNEITYQLARWSQQFDTNLDAPGNWSDLGKSGWQFASSIRAEAWTLAYFKLNSADNAAWSGADDTLLLYKLMQHGDWLYAQANTAKADASIDSNKSIGLGKALYLLGRLFPEFDTAGAWMAKGRQLVIDSMNAQVYADGSHREQSPSYAIAVAADVLDVLQLDKLNDDTGAWSGGPISTLRNLIETNRQFLSPDGRRPGIGDTNRTFSVSGFLRSGLILDRIHVTTTSLDGDIDDLRTSFDVANAGSIQVGDALTVAGRRELMRVVAKSGNTLTVQRGVGGTTADDVNNGEVIYDLGDQPFAKPTIGDVWALGIDATRPFVKVPAIPEGVLGDRGKAYAMPDGGNYILRSDDSSKATQLIFDDGPKGGSHGHLDLLNFELWSGGHPLIIDPGPYLYNGGADRDYVLSTKAHNTVNVDGQNVGWVEGEDQPALNATYDFASDHAMVTGTHSAYAYLDGAPTLTRSIWYDYGGTFLMVDWGEGASNHTFSQSFNVPGTDDASVSGASGGTEFRTRYASGGNVRVQTLNGGALVKGAKTFVTGPSSTNYKTDAYRYTVTKADTQFAVFVTLINTYTGLSVPNVSAQLLTTNPQPGQPIQVKLTQNGVDKVVTFTPPALTRPAASDFNQNALVSDMQYDKAGNLHVAFQDLEEHYLRYTVRSAATGKWSPVITVDDSAHGVGAQIDLALDPTDRPGIAYYDSANGDLKYASIITQNNAWRVQTIDSKTTVGQNPSLIFSRKGGSAIISYYNRTKGDLKIAVQSAPTTWTTSNFATGGDVGRFSHIMLDPNRTELNARWVILYEDRTRGGYVYAYQSGDWHYDLVTGAGVVNTGGYCSLAFEDSGSGATSGVGANRYVPRFTFYEYEPDASLWLAQKDKVSGKWTAGRIDGKGSTKKVGAYNQLSYATGRAEVFYYDDRNKLLRHAINHGGNTWTYDLLGPAGRELHAERAANAWTVFGFDTTDDQLLMQSV